MEIVPSARKHGISDDDIRHAFEHAVAAITRPGSAWLLDARRSGHSGRLLEIGVLVDDDNEYVIHAMPARPKYVKMIRANRGDQL